MGTEVLRCFTSTNGFYSPPPPLSKSSLKLVCNINLVYRNLKSENSQDYARNLNEIVRSWIRLLLFLKQTCQIFNDDLTVYFPPQLPFFNNILGINVRTSHFGVNATRYCFFCTKERNFSTDESFIHLFFDCPTVRNWHEAFIDEFIKPGGIPVATDKKKFLFTGILDNEFNYFEASAAITFQFSVWEEKL